MRKAGIVTIILFLLCSFGVYVGAMDIYKERNQVGFTEQVIYGEREAINGMRVKFGTTYKYHLLWDTVYDLKENGETETKTEYGFSIFSNYNGRFNPQYNGVNLEIQPSFSVEYSDYNKDKGFDKKGIGLAYQQLFETIEAGGEGEKEIYLKNYLDYYPITGNLDFPYMSVNLDSIYRVNQKSDYKNETYIAKKIQEYFKIPVLEEETFMIHMRKNENGSISSLGGGSTESDSYYMNVFNKLTENACYFTFDTHTREEKIIDTSHLKEGYGIYCLPYEEIKYNEKGEFLSGGIDIDNLKMVYPLEPEIKIVAIETNKNETKLLLHTIEEEIYMLTVIDIKTMELLQKLEIMDWNGGTLGNFSIYNEDDFMAIMIGGTELAVVSLEEKEEYKLQFVCNLKIDEIPWFDTYRSAVDFDGEKLVMTGQVRDGVYGTMEDTSNFYLAVYNKEGIVYYGEYISSLTTGKDADSYNYHCRGTDYVPLKVEWLNKK